MFAVRHLLDVRETKWSDCLAYLIERDPFIAASVMGIDPIALISAQVKRESHSRVTGRATAEQVDLEIVFGFESSISPVVAIIECKLLADFTVDQLSRYVDAYPNASHRLVVAPFERFLITEKDRDQWSTASWSAVIGRFLESKQPVVRELAAAWLDHIARVFTSASGSTVWSDPSILPVAKLAYVGTRVRAHDWVWRMSQGAGGSGYPLMEFFSYDLAKLPGHRIRVELQNAHRGAARSPLEAKFCLRIDSRNPERYNLIALQSICSNILAGRLNWKTRGGKSRTSKKFNGHFAEALKDLSMPSEWTYGYLDEKEGYIELGGCHQLPMQSTLTEVTQVAETLLQLLDEVGERYGERDRHCTSSSPQGGVVRADV